jgi:predicted Rossmann fold flavoprotein
MSPSADPLPTRTADRPADVVIIGAGAAGLATAIFTRRAKPSRHVVLIDGARTPGAKILVSGGSRCNVTNAAVTERDFHGGPPPLVKRILRAWPVPDTIAFFREIGVPLHEEANGKLFPDSNRARDVLDALLREAASAGVRLRTGVRVHDVTPEHGGFRLATSAGDLDARAVVLATGGLSLPKTGSDGVGYRLAARLGHRVVPTTPGLVPLVVDAAERQTTMPLSGISQPVRLDLHAAGRRVARITGALLWTHFGISGPAALDVSRHWLRARLEGHAPGLDLTLVPDRTFEDLEATWLSAAAPPRLRAATIVARHLPAAVAEAVTVTAGVRADRTMADLTRDERRRLVQRMLRWPLAIADSRGYNYAEVTAGGVDLSEVTAGTMESRLCPGLYFAGEILDVDGRLGGFNFQWAWASAKVAGTALAVRRG